MPILYLVTLETENGITKNESVVINPENIHGIQTVETTKSTFDYTKNPNDRRTNSDRFKVTESLADWKTALATASDAFLDLDTFPGNDSTKAVEAKSYQPKQVGYIETASASAGTSNIYINKGAFKLEKILVDHTLAEIIALLAV